MRGQTHQADLKVANRPLAVLLGWQLCISNLTCTKGFLHGRLEKFACRLRLSLSICKLECFPMSALLWCSTNGTSNTIPVTRQPGLAVMCSMLFIQDGQHWDLKLVHNPGHWQLRDCLACGASVCNSPGCIALSVPEGVSCFTMTVNQLTPHSHWVGGAACCWREMLANDVGDCGYQHCWKNEKVQILVELRMRGNTNWWAGPFSERLLVVSTLAARGEPDTD